MATPGVVGAGVFEARDEPLAAGVGGPLARGGRPLEALVGDTPLVPLPRLFGRDGPAVYLKLEQFNPGGSVKDRTALAMLRAEERAGTLAPGATIVESSSGNTAIGLSILGRERGYRVVAVCDRHLPAVKAARLRAFGADVVYLPDTPLGLDTVELRIAVAERIARDVPDAATLGQYSHPANPDVHAATTGPEITGALGGDVSAVVAAVGTCGTISGVGRHLRRCDQRIRMIGVEPEGSVIFGGPAGRYLVQGGGLSFVPSILDRSVVDEGLKIGDAEAFACLHEVAADGGWMLGGTGGLVVAAIRRVAPRYGPTDTIVGVIADGGDRYVDTLYDRPWLGRMGLAPPERDAGAGAAAGEAAAALGCTTNAIADRPGASLAGLCRELNIPVPA